MFEVIRKDFLEPGPIVPELGWPLVLFLSLPTAVAVSAATWLAQGQTVPVGVSGLLMTLFVVLIISLRTLNRRAQAVKRTPPWGRKFSKVAIPVALGLPLLALFPVASDPQRWAWVMVVIAIFEVALLLVAVWLSVRFRRTT